MIEVSKLKVGMIFEIVDGKLICVLEVSYYKLGKGNIIMCMKLCDVCIGFIFDISYCLEEKFE